MDRTLRKATALEAWRARLGEVPHENLLTELDSLNEIPADVIAAARRLQPERSAISFISAYLREKQEKWVARFLRDVVHGQANPREWKRHRFLVPDVSFVDQLIQPQHWLLSSIGGVPALRVVPTMAAWQAGSTAVGSPLRAEHNIDYRAPLPPRAVTLREPETEPIGEVDVAVRRWIAARIACVTGAKLGMDFANAAKLAAEFAPLSSWTHDAQVALRALVRESQLFYADHPDPPGFRGPDEWYRG